MSITLTKIEAVRYRVEIPEELHKYGKDKIFPFLRGVSKVFHGWFQSRRLKSIKGKQCIFNDNTPDLYGTENGKLPKNRSLDDGRIKKATITLDGNLTPPYDYIKDYINTLQ